jgi:purine-binding chemotaxis protein CheW
MSKQKSFAKEDVMEAYLDGLLTGYEDVDEKQVKAAKLLESATLREAEVVPPEIKQPEAAPPEVETEFEVAEQIETAAAPIVTKISDSLENTFQALFFEVAGLTLAVPLITLGGIHKIDKVGPLFGKPDWFKGVMLHREQKLNVVDTARWVMPDKVTKTLEDSLVYEYLIMLADSPWGLASDKLVNTVTLNKADVKWRENDNKRPWLAGMVKERMCALIDVYQLISMLNKGLSSDAQD